MAARKETYGITKDTIIDLLSRPDTLGMHAVGRALMALTRRQTYDERECQNTKHENGRGFTKADAWRGTSMAGFYDARRYLTAKQLAYWRAPNVRGIPRICKYWEQLLEDARLRKASELNRPYTGKPGVRGPINQNEGEQIHA